MADRTIAVFVPGQPAPQGSKRARPIYRGRGPERQFTGKVAQEESSKKLKPWREDIRRRLLDDNGCPISQMPTDALSVRLHFVMPRPKSTPKRSTPPAVKRPDLDKLIRGVLDAIGSASVWGDDSQVVELHATKRIAEPAEASGCLLHIQLATDDRSTAVDWRRIAVRLALAGGCSYHRLSTPDRDALDRAVARARDDEWLEAEVRAERTADAADMGPA